MQALEVLAGKRPWSVDVGDCLPWLRSLPDACVQLAVGSPPYEGARLYGVGFSLKGQDWVDWMVPIMVELCRVTDGLVCVNMAGTCADHRYHPVVEWLVSDLTRHHGLVVGPSPYCYFRFGVPGSGHQRYHRRDWEPVYCFCRPERLPLKWADNTATGHPPRWAPGGACSNRLTDGSRANRDVWGGTGSSTDPVRPDREAKGEGRRPRKRPSSSGAPDLSYRGPKKNRIQHGPNGTRGGDLKGGTGVAPSGHDADGNPLTQALYTPPKVANSGNVLREIYDAEAVRELLQSEGKIDLGDVVRCKVGKGNMGDPLCHANEAPFPERLAEAFVRSYCPPGGVALDPWCGSGTVAKVCMVFGRRFVGADLRQSQADLTARRLADHLGLFTHTPEGGGDGQAMG